MFWRLLGRVVTGPVAFLAAGAIDVLAFAAASLRARVRRRLVGSGR